VSCRNEILIDIKGLAPGERKGRPLPTSLEVAKEKELSLLARLSFSVEVNKLRV
jgi:hypothetical protein